MSIKNDRLVCRENRQNCQKYISLVMASPDTSKVLQKEKINGVCVNYDYVCIY